MYASAGLAAPARAGLSVVKAARRGGHLGAPLVRLLKVETREGVMQFAGNSESAVGAGMRGALDGLKVAEQPKDVASSRALPTKGSKTRAIVKLLGRGAIVLTASLFALASWMFWALLNLLAFCAACKRAVGAHDVRHCERRRKRRRKNQRLAMAAAAA